jgi:hypothetical protein
MLPLQGGEYDRCYEEGCSQNNAEAMKADCHSGSGLSVSEYLQQCLQVISFRDRPGTMA